MRALLLASVASLAALAGCTLVLDSDRHQGGDAGPDPCDVDGDGYRAASCGGADCDDADRSRYPGAVALCGDGVVQACPGSLPFAASSVFAETGELGRLPASTVHQSGTLGRDLALGAVPLGGDGYGTATLLALDLRGGSTMRPLRIDVPLAAPAASSIEAMLDTGGTIDLSLDTPVTSVDARVISPSTSGKIGVLYVDSSSGRTFSGVVDHAASTSRFGATDVPGVVDEPAAFDHVFFRRTVDAGTMTASILGYSFEGPALPPTWIDYDVPSDPRIRMITSTSSFLLLQDEDADFWFVQAYREPPNAAGHLTLNGQLGKAAWVAAIGAHVLAYRSGTSFTFQRFDCQDAAPSVCDPVLPGIGVPLTTGAGALGGHMFDARAVQGANLVFLFSRSHADGDELLVQLAAPDGASLLGNAFPLLDLRPSGERIRDARMDLTATAVAGSLVVAALVARSTDGVERSHRLVVGGLRACVDD